jgi:hypothetical protein
VRPVGLQPYEIVVDGRWQVVLATRRPAHDLFQQPNVRVGVEICLGEGNTGTHIEHVAQRCVRVAGRAQIGYVARDRLGRIERAAVDQYADYAPDDGLADRHQQVSVVGRHAGEVRLGGNPPVLQHEVTVGVRAGQHIADRGGGSIRALQADIQRCRGAVR